MISPAIHIVADYREKDSGVTWKLKDLGVKVTYQNLSVGDYVLSSEHAVERKTAGDFIASLTSGRLFDQAMRLSEAYSHPIFIVEGSLFEAIGDFANPRSILGALTFLALHYSLLLSPSVERTAELLYTLASQVSRNQRRVLGPVVKVRRKMETLAEKQIGLVSALPGVGPKTAERLLARFGSVRRVFSASVAQLASVEAVGRKRAERIGSLLDSPYKRSRPDRIQALIEEAVGND